MVNKLPSFNSAQVKYEVHTWNMRGLNGPHKMEVFRNIAKDHKPDILSIQETTMSKEKAQNFKVFKHYGLVARSAQGASGGTLIF